VIRKVVPMIHVPDVRATVEWYESIGFEVVATYGDETGENFSFAIVSYGDTQVMFNTGGEPSDKRRREVDLYVYTDDVDQIHEQLKARVEVIEGPHDTFYGMREVIVRDLNRFWITFGQENVYATLMSGIHDGDLARARAALESGKVGAESLNVALAFASATEKKSQDIVDLLTGAGAQPLPPVDNETLQSYAGTYEGDHGFRVEITLAEGRLFVAAPGGEPMSFWPLNQTTFIPVAITGAVIVFDVASNALTFTMNGHSTRLIRP